MVCVVLCQSHLKFHGWRTEASTIYPSLYGIETIHLLIYCLRWLFHWSNGTIGIYSSHNGLKGDKYWGIIGGLIIVYPGYVRILCPLEEEDNQYLLCGWLLISMCPGTTVDYLSVKDYVLQSIPTGSGYIVSSPVVCMWNWNNVANLSAQFDTMLLFNTWFDLSKV